MPTCLCIFKKWTFPYVVIVDALRLDLLPKIVAYLSLLCWTHALCSYQNNGLPKFALSVAHTSLGPKVLSKINYIHYWSDGQFITYKLYRKLVKVIPLVPMIVLAPRQPKICRIARSPIDPRFCKVLVCLSFLGNFKSSYWLTRFMKVILLEFLLVRIIWGTPNL